MRWAWDKSPLLSSSSFSTALNITDDVFVVAADVLIIFRPLNHWPCEVIAASSGNVVGRKLLASPDELLLLSSHIGNLAVFCKSMAIVLLLLVNIPWNWEVPLIILAPGIGMNLALSSTVAWQNARCVMKLSFLENRVPQSHLYSLVPQILA